MAFCSRAISSFRAFIRRFYDLIASVKNGKPYYSARLNREVKEDVMVWLVFLKKFTGECYIPERSWITNEALELITDSTGNALLGCGAYFSFHWVQYRWPSSWENTEILTDITFLELVPIVLSLIIWGPEFKDKKILLYIDKLVSIINKRTSKSKHIMKLIRRLVLFTMCLKQCIWMGYIMKLLMPFFVFSTTALCFWPHRQIKLQQKFHQSV